ncbi:MAG TPA: hypothetical protein VJL36_01795 [Candidatus Paceibacterota bacterium]
MTGRYESLKKTARRRPAAAWRLPVWLLLLVLVVAGGLAFFFNSDRFALRAIEIRGQHLLTAEMIATAARQTLAGRRWFFFRRDRYWFYSPTQLSAALRARFTRLAAVTPQISGWNTLQLQVTERRTAALWCAEDSVPTENCFYLDETGLAFARAPHFSASPLITIVGADPPAVSSTPLLNSQPLPRARFHHLLNLKLALEEFFRSAPPLDNFAVQKITATADGDYKFYFTGPNQTPAGFEIIITRTQTVAEILDRLESVLAVPEFQAELTPAARLEYLDLRFGHKIFYRFRN